MWNVFGIGNVHRGVGWETIYISVDADNIKMDLKKWE